MTIISIVCQLRNITKSMFFRVENLFDLVVACEIVLHDNICSCLVKLRMLNERLLDSIIIMKRLSSGMRKEYV